MHTGLHIAPDVKVHNYIYADKTQLTDKALYIDRHEGVVYFAAHSQTH